MFSVLKIPFDFGNPTGKRGPAAAPDILAKNVPEDIKIIAVKTNPGNFEETMNEISKVAEKEWRSGNKVLALGGDHSITYGLVRAASKIFPNLKLIYFDAHLDCEDDFLPPTHEDVIRAIINEKLISPEKILIIGVRKTWPKEESFIKKHFIKVIRAKPIQNFKSRAEKELKKFLSSPDKVYISLDIDVFDSSDVPGTNYPEKEGPRISDLFSVLKLISSFKRSIGFDICEVSPQLDFKGKTIAIASYAIRHFLTTEG